MIINVLPLLPDPKIIINLRWEVEWRKFKNKNESIDRVAEIPLDNDTVHCFFPWSGTESIHKVFPQVSRKGSFLHSFISS